jgi:nitrate/nitrite-specific signal transduction histidine kinase
LPCTADTNDRVIAYVVSTALHPMIRENVYRIGRETVVGAYLHADSTNIEVEVEYANRYFRALVCDDGRGIDPLVLDAGRDGHWGLPGVRERSRVIGSSLRLRSRHGLGTEVELTVPGTVAFDGDSQGQIWRWTRWFCRK